MNSNGVQEWAECVIRPTCLRFQWNILIFNISGSRGGAPTCEPNVTQRGWVYMMYSLDGGGEGEADRKGWGWGWGWGCGREGRACQGILRKTFPSLSHVQKHTWVQTQCQGYAVVEWCWETFPSLQRKPHIKHRCSLSQHICHCPAPPPHLPAPASLLPSIHPPSHQPPICLFQTPPPSASTPRPTEATSPHQSAKWHSLSPTAAQRWTVPLCMRRVGVIREEWCRERERGRERKAGTILF